VETQRGETVNSSPTVLLHHYYRLFMMVGQITAKEKVIRTLLMPVEKFGTDQTYFIPANPLMKRGDRSGFNLSFLKLQTNPIIQFCRKRII